MKAHKKWLLFLLPLVPILFFTCCGSKQTATKPNILLITIDTLRRDHLGSFGYFRNTSPYIDSLAKKGILFKNVITPLPLTAASHASILTSLHPLTHGVDLNGSHLDSKVQTIAEVLKNDGYYTIGTVAVKLISDKLKFSQGFDSFSDQWERNQFESSKYQRMAHDVNKSLIKQVEAYLASKKHNKKPLFIWVHYYDPHAPYSGKNHIHFPDKQTQNKKTIQIRKYDEEIRYTDEHIEKLHNFLAQKGLASHLLTAVTADHGEEFGEHGFNFGHPDFYSETSIVPLILHGYGIKPQKSVDTYVSTMDIATTLVKQAKLSFDNPVEGVDLLEGIRKNKLQENKQFLIMGNLVYNRSLQLFKNHYSFILNFDSHHKNWYIAGENALLVPEDQFQPLPKKSQKLDNNVLHIHLPKQNRRGRHFMVLRSDYQNNKGLKLRITVRPHSLTLGKYAPAPLTQLNVIYPITILEDIDISMWLNEGTQLKNIRYAILPRSQLKWNPEPRAGYKKVYTNKIFQKLLSSRKHHSKNEFFNLQQDLFMQQNLRMVKKLKPLIIKYKKQIYTSFNYYWKKKQKLFSGIKQNKSINEEEKKLLKSLGYL
jgi:Sulfatase